MQGTFRIQSTALPNASSRAELKLRRIKGLSNEKRTSRCVPTRRYVKVDREDQNGTYIGDRYQWLVVRWPTANLTIFRRFRITHLEKSDYPEALKHFWSGHAPAHVSEGYVKLLNDRALPFGLARACGNGVCASSWPTWPAASGTENCVSY
jgi:hypothetical protein